MSVNLCVQKRYLAERENTGAEAKIELHSPPSREPKPLLSHRDLNTSSDNTSTL